jgi:biotin carboxyl carrier protein
MGWPGFAVADTPGWVAPPVLGAPTPDPTPHALVVPHVEMPEATTRPAPATAPKPAPKPVAKAPVKKPAPPVSAMRYLVPSVLKSMGTTVPSFNDASIPGSAMTLDELLSVIRTRNPAAQVVAGFYDWRTVSVYRSQPGLHLGYDIANPAGTVIPSGWPGKVVAVAEWYGPEYGITVETNGYRTTYGHLAPLVKEGDVVMAGQPVGTVVHDHVDVKMRNATGDYVDFGAHQTSELAALAPLPVMDNPRDLGILKFMVAQETLFQAQDRLTHEVVQTKDLHLSLLDTRKQYAEMSVTAPKAKQYYAEGLIAKVDVEGADKKLATLKQQLADAESLASRSDLRLEQSRAEIKLAKKQLELVQTDNHRLGIGPADVTSFLTGYVHKHPGVLKDAQRERTQALRGGEASVDGSELSREKEHLEMLERLYADGAVSQHDVEEQRAKITRLESGQK